MARTILIGFLLAVARIAVGESLVIEPKHARFDASTASTSVQQTYTVSNRSAKEVRILEWKAISEHGNIADLPKTLLPGQSADFRVDLTLPGKLGESTFRYALFTDEADVERYRFTLSGFVFSVISPEAAVIDFGKILVDSTARHELTLEAREEIPLQLKEVVDAPDWIEARLQGSTVSVGIRPDASWGVKAGTIRVSTNLKQQPFVEITTKAIIEGKLKPSIHILAFKPTEVGQSIHSELELQYTGKGKLEDLEINAPGEWKLDRAACASKTTSESQCVRIVLAKTIKETGQVVGTLRFRMPGEPELSIPFGIMGLQSGQSVRELLLNDDEGIAPPEKIDITKAIRNEVESTSVGPALATSKPSGQNISKAKGSGPVRLRWKAANDGSIYGYMVYRATDRAGPYIRVTQKPLPKHTGAPPASSDADYEFVDESVEPGQTYFYYIDTMARNGTQQRLSPVLSKTVTP